ncbi:MAG: CtsR family transcriptional regulator [Hydrogenibacillus schlegelii]|uniref:Transcriptional regulator CtsR n=1 Tax=Hydrogenibacillus schlegelii TaxID=1484 RepID=A0A947CXU8_HYDSH|nr:CtsR family transcriptional regulator [Hydrogenibacillus schlegelii]
MALVKDSQDQAPVRVRFLKSISDVIEKHLKELIEASGAVEIKRVELAEAFRCVPSQINYVIQTRFTVERGYLVESKRGGGGYIRIQKIRPAAASLLKEAYHAVGEAIDERRALDFVDRLQEGEELTSREAAMLRRLVSREVLALPVELRDRLRARLLKAAMLTLMAEGGEAHDV